MDIKADLASLEPKNDFNRREFVVTMLAVGFAAAVRPIAAVTLSRPSSSVVMPKILISGRFRG